MVWMPAFTSSAPSGVSLTCAWSNPGTSGKPQETKTFVPCAARLEELGIIEARRALISIAAGRRARDVIASSGEYRGQTCSTCWMQAPIARMEQQQRRAPIRLHCGSEWPSCSIR